MTTKSPDYIKIRKVCIREGRAPVTKRIYFLFAKMTTAAPTREPPYCHANRARSWQKCDERVTHWK